MRRLLTLFRNLRVLSKRDLNRNGVLYLDYGELVENILYYCPQTPLKRPLIYTSDETTDVLCTTNKSIARFGDGEIAIMQGNDIPFQKYDETLATRLKEILVRDTQIY